MDNETLFLFVVLTASLLFAAFNGICMAVKRGKTAQAMGTVISLTSPLPDTVKFRNSKWAQVTYHVDGKACTSQNRVQVPLTAQIGSTVRIRYDMEQPDILYSYSLKRVAMSLAVAAVCAVIILFRVL